MEVHELLLFDHFEYLFSKSILLLEGCLLIVRIRGTAAGSTAEAAHENDRLQTESSHGIIAKHPNQ